MAPGRCYTFTLTPYINHVLTINMNMRIVMNMNIYITPQNQKRLAIHKNKGESMSGLINGLLDAHFGEIKESEPPVEPRNTPGAINTDFESIGITRGTSNLHRTYKTVLSEITALEDEWKDNLDPTIVQDSETLTRNREEFSEIKQALWDEYHELKEQDNVAG